MNIRLLCAVPGHRLAGDSVRGGQRELRRAHAGRAVGDGERAAVRAEEPGVRGGDDGGDGNGSERRLEGLGVRDDRDRRDLPALDTRPAAHPVPAQRDPLPARDHVLHVGRRRHSRRRLVFPPAQRGDLLYPAPPLTCT